MMIAHASRHLAPVVAILSALGGSASCHKQPTLAGAGSLVCAQDTDCPSVNDTKLRCMKKLCVFNSPPQTLAFDPALVRVEIGTAYQATAKATDADGDTELTFVWRQVGGPENTALFVSPLEGATLDVTPAVYGSYALEVVTHDNYDLLDPLPNGQAATLTIEAFCTNDAQCGSDLRCYEDDCQRNRLPTLATLAESTTATTGQAFSLIASATDPDGDAITISWTQLSGPVTVLAAPSESATLAFTPTTLGAYVFEVKARDKYDPAKSVGASSSQRVRVMVLPLEPTVYLSDSQGSADDADCGAFDKPCLTLGMALGRMRDPLVAATQVLVAAATNLDGYAGCLDLAGGEVVRGCFDPLTWEPLDNGQMGCRMVCGSLDGHSLAGTARIETLRLAISDGLVPANANTPAPTVRIKGGTPTLSYIDIETADCGPTCKVGGILSAPVTNPAGGAPIESSPTIECVDIMGGGQGFTTVDMYSGIYLIGGTSIVRGGAALCGGKARGHILLDAPTNSFAGGVTALRGAATISGLLIEGGLGPALFGIQAVGTTLTATNNTVKLTAFGTRSLVGIYSLVCDSTRAYCQCNADVEPCGVGTPVVPNPLVGTTTLAGNTMTLSSGGTTQGQVPCMGVGMQVEGARYANVMHDNVVSVGDYFALGVGSFASAGITPAGTLAGTLFQNNTLSVGSGTADSYCDYYNRQSGNGAFSGAIGLALGEVDATVSGNSITVGSHTVWAGGLSLDSGSGYVIEDNSITVGDAVSSIASTPGAVGALLKSTDTATSSRFARNRVQLGAGQWSSEAVEVSGSMRWELVNNTLFGGLGVSSVGLNITSDASDPVWPKVTHNTINAGGEATRGLVGRAVFFNSSSVTNIGVFDNNLLDGGEAIGRRFLMDNVNVGLPASGAGNLAQWHGSLPGVPPLAVLTPLSASAVPVPAASTSTFYAALPTVSEVATLTADFSGAPSIKEGTPLTTAGGIRRLWKDPFGEADVVVVLDKSVGVAKVSGGMLSDLATYATTGTAADGSLLSYQPIAAILAEANGAYPPDLVFTVAKAGAVDGGVYVMYGKPVGGYAAAVPLKSTISSQPYPTDPSWIAAYPSGLTSVVLVVEGTTLHVYVSPTSGPLAQKGRHAALSVATFKQLHLGQAADDIAVTSIQGINTANLGEASAGVDLPDLILLATNAVGSVVQPYVFPNPALVPLVPALPAASAYVTEALVASSACTGANATATTVVNSIGSATLDLWVGCAGGQLELYSMIYSTPSNHRLERFAPPYAGSGSVLTLTAGVLGSGQSGLAVLRAASPTLDAYRFNAGTLEGPVSYTFPADIAMRSGGQLVSTFAALGGTPSIAFSSPECALAFRNGGTKYDLHLAASDTGCKNKGATLTSPVTDDLDKQTRSDGSPDVGADEL